MYTVTRTLYIELSLRGQRMTSGGDCDHRKGEIPDVQLPPCGSGDSRKTACESCYAFLSKRKRYSVVCWRLRAKFIRYARLSRKRSAERLSHSGSPARFAFEDITRKRKIKRSDHLRKVSLLPPETPKWGSRIVRRDFALMVNARKQGAM